MACGLKNPRDLDLRQGPLAAQRSYEQLKERTPLLAGLAGAILVSFLFATWAELRALGREHEVLTTAMAALSRDVLGEETVDPERVHELLETGGGRAVTDPMPHADAFDMLVGISEAIPMSTSRPPSTAPKSTNIIGSVPGPNCSCANTFSKCPGTELRPSTSNRR